MGFGEAVSTCFRKYVDFQGRARRSEYWYFALFNGLALIGLVIVGAIIGVLLSSYTTDSKNVIIGAIVVLVVLYWLAIVLPGLAVAVRRFHDLGVTGWFVLIFAVAGAIPFVGWIASIGQLIWFCMRGTEGENDYGPDPYGPDITNVFS